MFSSTEHPWISFYTDRTLGAHLLKAKKNNMRSTSRQQASIHGTESERKRLVSSNSLSDDSSSSLASVGGSNEVVDREDSGLVDVLAGAISRVRISEPKRSRICSSPSRTIQTECPSNLKTSNLCTAF